MRSMRMFAVMTALMVGCGGDVQPSSTDPEPSADATDDVVTDADAAADVAVGDTTDDVPASRDVPSSDAADTSTSDGIGSDTTDDGGTPDVDLDGHTDVDEASSSSPTRPPCRAFSGTVATAPGSSASGTLAGMQTPRSRAAAGTPMRDSRMACWRPTTRGTAPWPRRPA